MANQYVNLAGDYESEMAKAKRDRQLAMLLSQQAQTPIEIQSSGRTGAQAPISWTSILAKGLQTIGAKNKEAYADEAEKRAAEGDRAASKALLRQLVGEDNKALGMRPIASQVMPITMDGQQVGQTTMPGQQGPGGVVNQAPSPQQQMAMLLAADGGPKTEAIRNAMLPRVFGEQDYQRGRTDRQADLADERGYQSGIRQESRANALTDDARNFQQTKDLATFQNNLGPTQAQLMADRRSREATVASLENRGSAENRRIRTEGGALRREFNNLPEVKSFNEIANAYDIVSGLAKRPGTAQDDLAAIFSFMKALDPNSVVRETEFATAQNAAGIPEQIRNQFNNVRSGQRLSPNQRAEFANTVKSVLDSRSTRYNQLAEQYKVYAADAELGDNIIVPRQVKDENAEAMAWANANPNDPRAAEIKKRLGGR